ncbi:MAG TPA: MotA/TolQ/ExbB proton channel family protein [Pirellulales bacterium]
MDSRIGRNRGWRPLLTVLATALVVAVSASFAAAAEGEPTASPQGESLLWWVARCSGWIGAGILLLSMYFVATVVRMFMELREKVASPPELNAQVEELIQQRDFRQVYKVLRESDSFLGRVLSTGISELPNGLPEARESMERAADAATMEMERSISMLAVIGTLGPMIGLLGTLKGMIGSFGAISRSGVHMDAAEVATGISEALLLTFEGVLLSVPAIYFYALFRNRISHISTNTTLAAEQTLRRLFHSAQWKAAPTATGTTPTK